MQLFMDTFAASSLDVRVQKFVQHLRRILNVDFGGISPEVIIWAGESQPKIRKTTYTVWNPPDCQKAWNVSKSMP